MGERFPRKESDPLIHQGAVLAAALAPAEDALPGVDHGGDVLLQAGALVG